MPSRRLKRRWRSLPVTAFALVAALAAVPAAQADEPEIWGAAMQPPNAGTEDTTNWSLDGFEDQTLRQVIRVSAGGPQLRIRLSNIYGAAPLQVAGATVAATDVDASVQPGTAQTVQFGGSSSTTIAAGSEAVSDAVSLAVVPQQHVTVTLRFVAATGPATFHRFTTATSYLASGNHLSDVGGAAFTDSTESWYYLTGVDVIGGDAAANGTVVAFGDSATDGIGATPGPHNYVDRLAKRLLNHGRPMGVVNAGIAGNRLLNDNACYGAKGLDRFERDVLDRPAVRSVIIELGLNDLGAPQQDFDPCAPPNPLVTYRQIIDGYQQLIDAAHLHGVRAIGATMGPVKSALFPFYSARLERIRLRANDWIRTSGAFDAVADFATALADPLDPSTSRADYVYVDGAHPNDKGYRAIARSIPLRAL